MYKAETSMTLPLFLCLQLPVNGRRIPQSGGDHPNKSYEMHFILCTLDFLF